eukprot:TRINITY_DN38501_c0_g1_i1.p1 TRINITY_DN38501_c0_g1~~TRINITY_DN38501_c0_g1_i1.p1  ORF type:complete len:660 (+),score=73.42 TRINITY_DN38501_c0_g1_i1:218-2197(+)
MPHPASATSSPYLSRFAELIFRRWLRVSACHVIFASITLVLWSTLPWLYAGLLLRLLPACLSPAPWLALALLFFSNFLFLAGKYLVYEPSYTPGASFADVSTYLWEAIGQGFAFLFGTNSFGGKVDPEVQDEVDAAIHRLVLTRRRFFFVIIAGATGNLALGATIYLQPWSSEPETARCLVLGSVLGLAYGVRHLARHEWVLKFSKIEHLPFAPRLKAALPPAATKAVRFSLAVPLVSLAVLEIVDRCFLGRALKPRAAAFAFLDLIRPFAAAFLVTFFWEAASILVEVVHTEHHRFLPEMGSADAELAPCGPLLAALDHKGKGANARLLRHLAFLDLVYVAEGDVDRWRRNAIFEETGDAYRVVVDACLRNVDGLTKKLKKSLVLREEPPGGDVTLEQMAGPGAIKKVEAEQKGATKRLLSESDICSWSVRSASALTAISRVEDRFGVAQLTGSNVRVVTSLLSCLLVVEAFLAKVHPSLRPKPSSSAPSASRLPSPSPFLHKTIPVFSGFLQALPSLPPSTPTFVRKLLTLLSSSFQEIFEVLLGRSLASFRTPPASTVPSIEKDTGDADPAARVLEMISVLQASIRKIVKVFANDMVVLDVRALRAQSESGNCVGGGGQPLERLAEEEWLPSDVKPLYGSRRALADRLWSLIKTNV